MCMTAAHQAWQRHHSQLSMPSTSGPKAPPPRSLAAVPFGASTEVALAHHNHQPSRRCFFSCRRPAVGLRACLHRICRCHEPTGNHCASCAVVGCDPVCAGVVSTATDWRNRNCTGGGGNSGSTVGLCVVMRDANRELGCLCLCHHVASGFRCCPWLFHLPAGCCRVWHCAAE